MPKQDDPLPESRQHPSERGETAPLHDLPDLATRIAAAQDVARRRREELGLPPEADDGGYEPRKRARKHAPKRHKKHGQFLGTVCDGWPKV